MARPSSNRSDSRNDRPGGGSSRGPGGGAPRRPSSSQGRPPRRDDGPPRERREFSGDGRPPRRDEGPPRERRSFSSEGRPPRRDDGPPRRESSNEGRPPRRDGAERPRRGSRLEPATIMDGPERLQKIMAQAGIGSRRACELLMLEGRVTVDGVVANELGAKVDPKLVRIAVDGQKIQPEQCAYYLVYKPKGYVSTSSDPSGRPLVQDLIPKAKERIFIVGRLDRHSEGLMLLTNDGTLAQRLTHPKYGVEKTYRVTVAGDAGNDIIQKLTDGVWLAEGKVRARRARIVNKRGNATVLEIVLAEGKNREIRRMLARFDHKVMSLLRVAIGPLQLKGLSEGAWRALTDSEVDILRTGDWAEEEDHGKKPSVASRIKSAGPARDRTDSAGPRSDRPSDSATSRSASADRPRRSPEERRPARSRRDDDDDNDTGGDEEVVFTDRMETGGSDQPRRSDRPAARENRDESPRGRFEGRSDGPPRGQFGPRSDGPPRGRFEGRSDGPPRGQFGPRSDGPPRGRFAGRPEAPPEESRGRSLDREKRTPQRDDRLSGRDQSGPGRPSQRAPRPDPREGDSSEPRRTILGQSREAGPVKRRGGPSSGLPPRKRRRPS